MKPEVGPEVGPEVRSEVKKRIGERKPDKTEQSFSINADEERMKRRNEYSRIIISIWNGE